MIVQFPLEAGGDTPSILLVEDDRGDALLIMQSLADVGIPASRIEWTRSAAEAVAAVKSTGPGCVLLDLGLPDAEGLSALHDIVEADPDVTVIVLTGRHDPTGIEAVGAGAQDYLVKDAITGDLLGRSIRYAIERRRAQQAREQLREARLGAAEQARLERGLLPTPLLRTDAVECATYYQPGHNHAVLGGDFFDVIEVTNGRIRAVIGDVMGHGPDEAALGVHLRVAWRTLVLAGTPDSLVLPALAELLATERSDPSVFVTACDLMLDTVAEKVSLRVAGHPAPLMCADYRTRYLDVTVGPPLGISGRRFVGWPETRVSMPGGSSLLLYTDGLLDSYASSTGRGSLGIDEVVDAVDLASLGGGSARTWIPRLVGAAPNTSVDDSAVVVLTSRPTGTKLAAEPSR